MDSHWIDKGKYWVTQEKQLSDFWCKARLCRITGSKISGLVNHSKKFTDSVKTSREIAGVSKATHTFSQQDLMKRGITAEPHVRKWYSEKIGKNIDEMSLAVPKWDVRFGSSVDGTIDEMNICEIKVPQKMYFPLMTHRNLLSQGEKFDKYYHRHIWDSHYDQMQLGMAVTGAEICHYIVYLPDENDMNVPLDVYYETIPFNVKYWNQLYTEAVKKYDDLVVPLMEQHNLIRLDPR